MTSITDKNALLVLLAQNNIEYIESKPKGSMAGMKAVDSMVLIKFGAGSFWGRVFKDNTFYFDITEHLIFSERLVY